MTTRVTRSSIDPIKPAPRWRIGLFENSGAQQLPPNAIQRLAGGVAYQALDATLADPAGSSFDPCETFEIDESAGDLVTWNSWGISRAAECSSLTGGPDVFDKVESDADALITAQSSYLGEYTFWTGIVGASTFAGLGWPNRPLASALATDLTPIDGEAGVVEAFGLIYEYLADTLRGLRGVIHVPPQLLSYAQFYGSVIRDGFTLGTGLADHLVIAGSGYTGSGPGNIPQPDNRTWIYATSMVRVGQSTIETPPATLDRSTNNVTGISYRAQLAEWDLTAHAAVRVCLTDPGPECATAGS